VAPLLGQVDLQLDFDDGASRLFRMQPLQVLPCFFPPYQYQQQQQLQE
jgi:hypothetical protein